MPKQPTTALSQADVERLTVYAGSPRDQLIVRLLYRHGLRVSELVALRWPSVDFKTRTLTVPRQGGGTVTRHTIQPDVLAALVDGQAVAAALERGVAHGAKTGRRITPMTGHLFNVTRRRVQQIIADAGHRAGFAGTIGPHDLREACKSALEAQGWGPRLIQEYLGLRSIQSAVPRAARATLPGTTILAAFADTVKRMATTAKD